MTEKVKRQRTKCRGCAFYRRVKRGFWSIPDWISKAGICLSLNFLRCEYINTIIGKRSFYQPRERFTVLPAPFTIIAVEDHQQFIAGWKKRSMIARLQADNIK